MNEVKQWESAIQCEGRVVVLEHTASTQDAAIELTLTVGDVCAAIHQSAGRGRRGNEWDSKGGVALTVVLPKATPQLSIAVAPVLAGNLESLLDDHTVGIKWPNDLLVQGRKLAGILIEQRRDICLVGIGVNVVHVEQDNAVSLRELGSAVDCSSVANLVVSSVFTADTMGLEAAVSLWRSRDVLVGTTQQFLCGNQQVQGKVLQIDPLHNLILETKEGVVSLPAATTTNISTRQSSSQNSHNPLPHNNID